MAIFLCGWSDLKARPYNREYGKSKVGQRPFLSRITLSSGIQSAFAVLVMALRLSALSNPGLTMLAKYSHPTLGDHRTSWI
jgi:hypothetical protein